MVLNFVGLKIPIRHWCRTFDYTNKGRLQLSDWWVSILDRAEPSQAGAYKKGNCFYKRRRGNSDNNNNNDDDDDDDDNDDDENDDDDDDNDDNKTDDNDSNNFT